jgi:DNA-binding CsgD family transcriptional regulator
MALGEYLTGQQRRILQEIANGRTNYQIAAALHISVSTVEYHARRIREKLGASTRIEAVAIGLQIGIVDPNPKVLTRRGLDK